MYGDKILIVDLGGYQARTIAHILRGDSIYCEISRPSKVKDRLENCRGIIVAGEKGHHELTGDLLGMGLPLLAMGASARQLCGMLGGSSAGAHIEKSTALISFDDPRLFEGIVESERYFERADILELPDGCRPIAYADVSIVNGFTDNARMIYALQFYAESNDPDGMRILSNFARGICGCEPWWSLEKFADDAVEKLRRDIGGGTALMSISGGVDSTVCAALTHKAIGDRLMCLYVNTGLMRMGEPEMVKQNFAELGLDLITVDASERFLARLEGITDPDEKRAVVRDEMLNVVADEARRLGKADYLVEATIYPDILSGSGTHTLESGYRTTLMERLQFDKLSEPLIRLFKDEVRYLGELLGMPRELIGRQPFPEAGLAVRCLGEVTREKLSLLSRADAIFREEIVGAGLDKRVWQYFAVLTGLQTNGTRDGNVERGHAVALRAVSSKDAVSANYFRLPYDLIERVVERITGELPQINRVLYDVTGKPPALIEWE